MATKGEVRRGVEKYLKSQYSNYNNSIGQFDRVIMGVLSTMGSTLLQPDDPKFDKYIGIETERMLTKYGPGTDYYNERFGKKGKNKDSANGSIEEYYSKMAGKSKSEVEKIYMKAKGNPNAEEAYKKWLSAKDSAMVYDPIMCMMVPVKDQRTIDADIERIADYLWIWSVGGSPTDPLHEIANELEKLDKTSKTHEEHQEFVKKNYKPLLDKIYANLKRTVNKRLEDGYKRIDSTLKSR